MTAFNAVHFRVKPGRDQEFLDAHSKVAADWPGLRSVNVIKTDGCAAGSPESSTGIRSIVSAMLAPGAGLPEFAGDHLDSLSRDFRCHINHVPLAASP